MMIIIIIMVTIMVQPLLYQSKGIRENEKEFYDVNITESIRISCYT